MLVLLTNRRRIRAKEVQVLNRLKLSLKRLLAKIPSRLPQGLTEFEAWVDDIYEMSGTVMTRDSVRFALATTIINLPPTASRRPKAYFIQVLQKGAASEVSAYVFHDIKQKQKAAQEAAQQEAMKKAAEEKTKLTVVEAATEGKVQDNAQKAE